MKRSRSSTIKRERILMMISSLFVLAALTVTGIYMRGKNEKGKNDGYTIDFEALENQVQNKYAEIEAQQKKNELKAQDNLTAKANPGENDLDYAPVEEPNVSVGSGMVKNPVVTKKAEPEAQVMVEDPVDIPLEQPETVHPAELTSPVISEELHFAEADKIMMPVSGDIKIPFNMSGSVYFQTLDQYKYNPALIIGTAEGTPVKAGVAGKVIDVFENEEIGHALILDLGDGYQAVYGQLSDISVTIGSIVEKDTVIAKINKPTKYYSLEGPNLYFQVLKDKNPVDPQKLF